MDAAAEIGRNPVSTRFSLSMTMSRLTRDGTAEPVSRDQSFRRERGQGNIHFPCSAEHAQDWQLYPLGPCCSCYVFVFMYGHTYSRSMDQPGKVANPARQLNRETTRRIGNLTRLIHALAMLYVCMVTHIVAGAWINRVRRLPILFVS